MFLKFPHINQVFLLYDSFLYLFCSLTRRTFTLSLNAIINHSFPLIATRRTLPPYIVTSSENKQGRDELLEYIEKINKELKEGQD